MDTAETLQAPAAEPVREGDLLPVHVSWRGQITHRFLHTPSAVIGSTLVLVIVVLSLLAPLIARYDPETYHNFLATNQLPSGSHWFGTDYLGRDLWSRVLYGGRVSLLVGFAIVGIEFGIGVPVGLLAGYGGKVIDEALMRLIDVKLALPGLLLPLGVIAVLGSSLRSTVVALGIAGIPIYTRVSRAATLKVRQQDYIAAAQAGGCSSGAILRRHVLPNVLGPLVVQATLSLGGAILAASALSYLGVGSQPPTADWGTLLKSGYEHMFQAWNEALFPGLAVCLAVLGINLLGDGLADALNPRL